MSATFGETLQRIRERRGWSLTRLERVSQTKHSQLYGYERGTVHPTRPVVERLAEHLDCTAGERYELLAAAGFRVDEVVLRSELVDLNDALNDDRISEQSRAYALGMIGTMASWLAAERQRTRLAIVRRIA